MSEFAPISLSRREPEEREVLAVRWIGSGNLPVGGGLLLRILSEPNRLRELSLQEWGDLIPVAKFTGLWPQIVMSARRIGAAGNLPAPIRSHLQSAEFAAAGHDVRMRWEIDRLRDALSNSSYPIILLKGAAYLMCGCSFAEGRYFGDVDILVPKQHLNTAENALRARGWVGSTPHLWHELYFRRWLQELAPMWHQDRHIQVDIHHTIIPPKDRIPFNPSSMISDSVPLGEGSLYVLSPADMFLHAAANLFRTGEFTFVLRDLWDMHGMLHQFTQQPGYLETVVKRAAQLHLERSCFYALRYLGIVCGVQIPTEIIPEVNSWRPGSISLRIVDTMVRRTLLPKSVDRVDGVRDVILTLREYWPPPRLRTICSPLFWRKRLPDQSVIWNPKTGRSDKV